MRVCCPHCKERFDVAHAAVLAEAAMLKDGRRKVARLAEAQDGNRLDPNDAEAVRLRREAVERRMKSDRRK